MAYEANRRGSYGNPRDDIKRSNANNAKNVRNAADVAIASRNPHAMAAGAAVKGIDAVTGGKASEAVGKVVTQANRINPVGRKVQNLSNNLAESGASDSIGSIASRANRGGERNNQVVNNRTTGGDRDDSLPSSNSNNQNVNTGRGDNQSGSSRSSNVEDNQKKSKPSFLPSDDSSDNSDSNGEGQFKVGIITKVVVLAVLPFVALITFALFAVGSVVGIFADYDDAMGVSFATGNETGNTTFTSASQEQRDFYDRINNVELDFLASGKVVDSLKVVGVFHVLNSNGASISYEDMTESAISDIASSMLDGNIYNEDTFKKNLINSIFPKYLPNSDDELRKKMADEVIDYVERYNSLLGKGNTDANLGYCSSTGANCSYGIKGYYIEGKGNVTESLQINNVYVRLMQCGTASGHNYGGTFGQPLAGEELVPFEKYVLGVAYQEIGPSAPAEAIKAQMVAARSFILARHADMGDWRTLKKESDDKWVIQAASCTQDQVYCDPDKGCSGNSGQWGQVYSGTGHNNGFVRAPLDQNSPLRTYLSDTSGEVLVNAQGYIVYTGYTSDEQNKFSALANNGLNYKQILLQVYNQGSRNYGASNIGRASCTGNSLGCRISNSDYATWKQVGASWSNVVLGQSGNNIAQIGCLATSISILIAKSGVATTISNFNPGTFVEFMNKNGGFDYNGNLQYAPISKIAPNFRYVDSISVYGMSREQKLSVLSNLLKQSGVYVVAEVKGDTGQHWVAVDSISGNSIKMYDPGSQATDMWSEYNWNNTSRFVYFRAG